MGPQFLLWGGGSYPWGLLLERLRGGEPDAYFITIWTALGIAVTLWAVARTMKK